MVNTQDTASSIAEKVGISRKSALVRMKNWHPLRWFEPRQQGLGGINRSIPAPRSHPWSSQSFRIKRAEKALRRGDV